MRVNEEKLRRVRLAEAKARIAEKRLEEVVIELEEAKLALYEMRDKDMFVIKCDDKNCTDTFYNIWTANFTPNSFQKDEKLKKLFSQKEVEALFNFDTPEKIKKFLKKLFPNRTFLVEKDDNFNKETGGWGIDKSCQSKMHDVQVNKTHFFKKK